MPKIAIDIRIGIPIYGPLEWESAGIKKAPTQIEGLDAILQGGLPAGRTTIVSGGPGTGKTVLGLQFLYLGAVSGKPGIFITFEETGESIRRNALTFGWDLSSLEKEGKFFLMEADLDPYAFVSGDFNLRGVLAIMEGKAREMGTDRIVIDAMDILMRLFEDPKRRQSEIFGLNKWLKGQKMTALMTTKNVKGADSLPEFGFLDFMADCVIYLDQRVKAQVSTKRLQVIKYRGSGYSTNEIPFLIGEDGFCFFPITDTELNYKVPSQRISSGNQALDVIAGGGYQVGTCILISGTSGSGKTTVGATFALSACEKGQKVLYVNYEESPDSMSRGMLSLGIDLRPAIRDSNLRINSVMPESMGIEEHLYQKIQTIKSFQPQHLVLDAISALDRIAGEPASFDFLLRLISFCKKRGITVLLINQVRNNWEEISGIGISSVIDTIITLSYTAAENEMERLLCIRKSRAANHSTRFHKFLLTENGFQLYGVQPEMNMTE